MYEVGPKYCKNHFELFFFSGKDNTAIFFLLCLKI